MIISKRSLLIGGVAFTGMLPGISRAVTNCTCSGGGGGGGGGEGGPLDTLIQAVMTNFVPSTQFTNTVTAYNAVKNNTGPLRIAFVGDSTTAGHFSTFPATTAYRQSSAPAFCAAALSGYSGGLVTGSFDNYIGDSHDGASADSRFSVTGDGSWSVPPLNVFGGFCATCSSGGSLNFRPTGAFDHIRIIYSQAGTFSVGVDSGTPNATHAVSDASLNMATQTWTVSHGTHTINIVGTSGATPCLIQSIEAYDTTAYKVECLNGGIGGAYSTILNTASTGQTMLAGLLKEAPHCTFINIGINDGAGTSGGIFTDQATFQANITNGVTALQAINSDVVLVVTTAIFGGAMESTFWSEYRDALYSIASSKNVPVLNLHDYYPTWAVQNAKTPTWMADGYHPTAPFLSDIGNVYAQVLLSGVGYFTVGGGGGGGSGFALLSHVQAQGNAATPAATASINTTGANIIIIIESDYAGVGNVTVSDSASNTWTHLTSQSMANPLCRISYVIGPTTSATHTFTYSGGGYGALSVMAFSKSGGAVVFDTQSGSTSAGATVQPGSIIAAGSPALIVSGLGYTGTSAVSINSGMTIADQQPFIGGAAFGSAGAYLIQTTAAGINPTWTAGNNELVTVMATFH